MPSWFDRLLPRKTGSPAPASPRQPTPPELDASGLIAQGNALLQQGQFAQAEARYRGALARDPRSLSAAVNLGFVLLELARAQEAQRALESALAIDPTNVDALFMLGQLALQRGDAALAATHLTRLLEIQPAFALAYPPLCRAHSETNEPERAKAVALAGLAIDPGAADLHHALGNIHLLQSDAPAAAASYRAALSQDTKRADTRVSLGHALLLQGQSDEARVHLLQALADRPSNAPTYHLLGTALNGLGLSDTAIEALERAIGLDDEHATSHESLGLIHRAGGRHAAALACFQRLTQLKPEMASAWSNLGLARQDLKQFAAAENCYRRAIELNPGHLPDHAYLGVLALERGATAEALRHFDNALQLEPAHLDVRGYQLWALCHGAEPAVYGAAAREYGRRAAALARPFESWLVERAEAHPQPLRVGLVSGDLRAHPVGFFIESVLQSLATRGIAVHAFPTSPHADDEVTARLKQRCAGWTPLLDLTDEAAANRIREERIHILVDLAGHTAHHRLRVFAWRPAPVQVSWLGFFATTGIETMDYLIADEASVPDALLHQFTETVWRMPHTRLCFTPPAAQADFPVTPLPALEKGHVTLGCYQTLGKVTDGVLAAWRHIMQGLPTARLRLQSKQTDAAGREPLLQRLGAAGIPIDRVTLAPPAARASYLASYSEVDLLLDTFPFPGGTTTCEALWMGVPTVTMDGDSMMANQGKALLTCAGLPDWVAHSEREYVHKAIAYGSDLPALTALRSRLRQQVLASPLFDGERFAADLEQALYAMWQQGGKLGPAARRQSP